MPLKLLGCAALILAGTAVGFLKARSLSSRKKLLRSVGTLMQDLATRLRYQSDDIFTSVTLAAKSAGLSIKEDADRSQGFLPWWERQTKEFAPPHVLHNSDKELLFSFGSQLGATDLEGQLSHIELCRTLLSKQLSDAEEELKQKGRLYRTLGVFGGVSAAIMLI